MPWLKKIFDFLILYGMYNLQDTSIVPHGKISLLNSAIIACSCCQMTWQFVSFDNALPSMWGCCCFLWHCQVSGTQRALCKYAEMRFPLWDVESVWVAECFILPEPEGKTFWTGLVLALQNGDIWLSVPAGMSFWLALSWYRPTPSYTLSPAGPFQGSWELVTCRGSDSSKHVSTCLNPIDVSETSACY